MKNGYFCQITKTFSKNRFDYRENPMIWTKKFLPISALKSENFPKKLDNFLRIA